MDGEGGEWSRRFDGGGVVVWIGDLLCWLGEEEKCSLFSLQMKEKLDDQMKLNWKILVLMKDINVISHI